MKKGILIVLIIIVLVAAIPLGVYLFFNQEGGVFYSPDKGEEQVIVDPFTGLETTVVESVKDEGNVTIDDTDNQMEGVVIIYADNGFSPSELTVNAGDVVTFENQSSEVFWPASAIHPTHKAYPDSNIAKCGTDDADNIFDSCGGIDPGESYSFLFNEAGSWKYHNHLSASFGGTVIVKGDGE